MTRRAPGAVRFLENALRREREKRAAARKTLRWLRSDDGYALNFREWEPRYNAAYRLRVGAEHDAEVIRRLLRRARRRA